MKIDSEKPCILIWSKEKALQEAISYLLKHDGLETFHISDQHDLFKFLEESQQPIVILDDTLPGILGFEVYEIIKRIERFKDIKIILLSSAPRSIPEVEACIEKRDIKNQLLVKIRGLISGGPGMSGIIDEPDPEMQIHEDARRLARIIVTDIVLYNKEKAERGAREGTFYELLKEEIEEGRKFYSERVPETMNATTNYFDRAIEEFIQKNQYMPTGAGSPSRNNQ